MPTVPFYDCGDSSPNEEGFVDIERIYCFDFGKFAEPEWRALQNAFESLPGWLGAPDLPRWFGSEEGPSAHLWASVEPPGLQVAGTLPQHDWARWDGAFRAATSGLPARSTA